MTTPSALFRALPAMDGILTALAFAVDAAVRGQESVVALADAHALASAPRALVRQAVTEFLDSRREAIRQGRVQDAGQLALSVLLPDLARNVAVAVRPHFRRVLNATGVVIHTNLGRSVLAEEAVAAVTEACRHYSNLEFDLDTGGRGSRYSHVEALLCRLTGAESALVVNNNAAAVLLVLDTLCKGREVVVSRGELVEIGGSFRIPEVMERSGCLLREVGATNRTHARDYAAAIGPETAALMKVHTSNFLMRGFVKSVSRTEMASLAHEHGLPAIEDLGSGCLFNFAQAGAAYVAHEPTVQEAVASGMDVVTLSGDKVLGGPQAGIILGRTAFLDRIKHNPLNRALRIDKMTLAALEATLRLYLEPERAQKSIPTLRMMLASGEELQRRAKKLARMLRARLLEAGLGQSAVSVRPGASRVGGGAFPESDLPTYLVAVACGKLEDVRQRLLTASPPLVVRLEQDALCLDPRTLLDEEFGLVVKVLAGALGEGERASAR